MNIRTLAAASAAFGLLAAASGANAAVSISLVEEGNLFGPLAGGQGSIIYDFDAIADPNVSYTGDVLQGPQQNNTTASPPYGGDVNGDTTKYASVQGGDTGTFSALPGFYLSTFSFYLGSPDTFNTLTFNFLGGGSQTFNGKYIWGGTPPGDGNRNMGFRVYYDFGGAKVTSVTFGSTNDAFEFDGIGGNVAAIPEPGTWALMIMGFGGAGAMLRRRKAALA
jgi:hypothetical protein